MEEKHRPHSGGWRVWNRESRRGGRNQEKEEGSVKIFKEPQAVRSETGSGSSLCLPTQQQPKTYVAPDEERLLEDQSERY